MKVLRNVIASAVLVTLVSCSVLGANGKRIDYGAAAVQVPSLELPPDLTAPAGDDRYKVPQGGAGTVATYSDYSKIGNQNLTGILPDVPGVHMEHDNTGRWLTVNEKAENVWPVVKAFWQDLGLTISSEDRAAGVMETAWVENRAKVAHGSSRNDTNDELNNAYEASERDQYLTRLERSKDGKNTEIYITHRGIKEDLSASKGASKWIARANDPELEAIMLQRLMVRFGASETRATSEVVESGSAAASPVVAASAVSATSPAASEPAGMASLREKSAGNTIIEVNDAFDRTWRKVGLAIDSTGLKVEDKDREKGIYYLSPVKLERGWLDSLKFWKRSEVDTSRHYRVNVKDGGTSCVVSIVDQDGASNKVSRQMLEAIYKNINQQQ